MQKKRDPMPSEEATDELIAEFWDTHSVTDYLDELEVAEDVFFVKPEKQVISIRLEPKYVYQLKAVASRMGVGYTLLARRWVMEKLQGVLARAKHS